MKFTFAKEGTLNGATPVTIYTARSVTGVVHVTKLTLTITTHAAATVTAKDSTTGKVIAAHTDASAAAGVPSVVTWDFGKRGITLHAGENLVAVTGAGGTAGIVYAEGYEIA